MSIDEWKRAFDELERLIKKNKAQSEKHIEFNTLKLLWYDLMEKEESVEGLPPSGEYEKRRILKLLTRISIDVASVGFMDLAHAKQAAPVTLRPHSASLDKRVFISYATDDYESYVRGLVEALDHGNIAYWIDRRDIPAGKDWASVIDTALEACPLLILCVTQTSFERRNVEVEWRFVMEAGKPVIPLVFDQPKQWPSHLKSVQYINATSPDTWENAFQKVVSTVKTLLK
jgi:hypothetical protein